MDSEIQNETFSAVESKPEYLQPTKSSERIHSLDVLRGFALLGILIVNIQSFGLISTAYQFPTTFGDLTGVNYWSWWVTFVFFDSKMMATFSMLFGAGIVLMSERAMKKTGRVVWLHYRRMFWLLVFGLAHAHVLWFGDILFSYALCGMIVFWLRNLSAKWLIPIGLIMLAVSSLLFLASGYGLSQLPAENLAEFENEWKPTGEKAQKEIEIYRGSWSTQLQHRVPTAFVFETFIFVIFTFWRAGGLMLIGMALFKTGVFKAIRSNWFYLTIGLICFPVGYVLVLQGIKSNVASDWDAVHSMFYASQYNYWGSLFVCLGYVCVIMLWCKTNVLTWLKKSLQAVGQMALTNYLMQTIICTLIFYGHGLGMFCKLERYQLVLLVITIWIVQMIFSPIWLKQFRFGPFEWVWRSLAYWKMQPMMRTAANGSSPNAH